MEPEEPLPEPPKKRLFIALTPDQEARRGIEKVLKKLHKKHWKVRWEPLEKWHATLLFLGWAEPASIPLITQSLITGTQTIKPFTLRFKGLGSFPTLLLPRVIWLGLRGDLKSLYRLRKQLMASLDQSGIGYDTKPFEAHLTLGRIEAGMSRKQRLVVGQDIKKLRRLDIPQAWLINSISLYQSRMVKGASQYSIIETVKLNTA